MVPIGKARFVDLKKHEGVNVLTISNGVNNALTNDGLKDLISRLSEAMEENDNPVMITGSGARAFSMGYSASCEKVSNRVNMQEAYSLGTTLARMILRSDRPIVAAVNGYALGLGLEIALCTDFIIASPTAKFGMPEIRFGIPSLTGFIPEIPDKFPGRVLPTIKTGQVFSADEAKRIGMVSTILEGFNFIRDASAYCEKLKTRLVRLIKSPESVHRYREVVDDVFFQLYTPSCKTMVELERFRNNI